MKSREKRFKQVVHFVEDRIRSGEYRIGDRIPSVNAWGIRFGLSRSSVFLAMDELKSRGLIQAEPSVGYFVASSEVKIQEKVLLLFNEFTAFKEDIYNSFMASVGEDVHVDIMFHNYNRTVFDGILRSMNGSYTTYVLMPGKFEGLQKALSDLTGYVILLDHCLPELKGLFPFLGQDFALDTYNALRAGLGRIPKCATIALVQKDEKEPEDRYLGITRFCEEFGFQSMLIDTMKDRPVEKNVVYMTATDRELVDIIKKANDQGLVKNKDFGLVSFNETPVKEILCGGITTLSTDFKQMGKTLARMVKEKKMETIYNPCKLIIRESI